MDLTIRTPMIHTNYHILAALLVPVTLFGMNTHIVSSEKAKQNEDLFKASFFGITYDLEDLLEKGAETSAQDGVGNTPLHIAMQNGHHPCVKILLRHNAAVNSKNVDGVTPLLLAIQIQDATSFNLLLNAAQVDLSDVQGISPLHAAVTGNCIDFSEELLQRGASPHCKDIRGETPLHYAARLGYKEIAELLLKKGARVNTQNTVGHSPLHLAVLQEQAACAEVLIRFGADIFLQDTQQKNSLDYATACQNQACLNVLDKHFTILELVNKALTLGAINKVNEFFSNFHDMVNAKDKKGLTPIFYAASTNYEGLVKHLLAVGADPQVRDNQGKTPVHHAAQKGGFYALSELLAVENLSFDSKDNQDATPLMCAALNDQETTLDLLLKKGADPFCQGQDGGTALHLAATKGANTALKKLAKIKGLINIRNAIGNTALHNASFAGHTQSVRILLDAGAQVELTNQFSHTALHVAATSHEGSAVIQALLEKEANPNKQDLDSNTPLHFCAGSGFDKSLQVLLENGADTELKDASGKTPLFLAVVQGHEISAKLLLKAGAEIVVIDGEGKSLIQASFEGKSSEILKLLFEYCYRIYKPSALALEKSLSKTGSFKKNSSQETSLGDQEGSRETKPKKTSGGKFVKNDVVNVLLSEINEGKLIHVDSQKILADFLVEKLEAVIQEARKKEEISSALKPFLYVMQLSEIIYPSVLKGLRRLGRG